MKVWEIFFLKANSFILFLSSFLWGIDWDYTHLFVLKKDQIAKVKIFKSDGSKLSGDLRFRWTLFVNEGLVLLVKYEGFPTQYVLYKKYQRDSIRIWIKKKPSKEWLASYLLIQFSDFDLKKDLAFLKVFIKDPSKDMDVSFIDPKRK